MRYQFTRAFSMAHRLYDGPSCKCHTVHGHTWKLIWSVDLLDNDINPATGMIKSFAELKTRVHEWIDNHVDHSIALSIDDPLYQYLVRCEPDHRILSTPFPPTTEVLALVFYKKLFALTGLRADITIEETPTNTIIYTPDRSLGLEAMPFKKVAWCTRNDYSINDLTPKLL